METLPDYYRLLHVHPDAPAPVIKASYRAMMQNMRLHPDLGGEEAVAQQLNDAVAILCDPVRRLAYDAQIAHLNKAANTAAPGGTPSTASGEEGAADSSDNPADASAKQTPTNPKNTIPLPGKPHCPFCLTTYPSHFSAVHAVTIDVYATLPRCSQCHGAATPISQYNDICGDDLRRMYRHDHKTPVLIWDHWPTDAPITAHMTDLSITGCALECRTAVSVDAVVLIDSPLLNGIGKIRYSHRIASNSGDVFCAGLEFLTLQFTSEPGAVFSATA